MDERLTAVYSASRNLYPYLPAAYMSLIDHNPGCKVYLFIEDDELPYEIPEECECVNVSKQKFFGERCANAGTKFTYLSLLRACYTKLFTGEKNRFGIRTLPKLGKILQLDVDTVVCESLAALWGIDMDGKWFAAVPEHLSNWKPFGKNYWNFGVVLFGLDAMREDGIDDAVIADLNVTPYRYIDQDAFCRVGAARPEKTLEMGIRYNECFCTGVSPRPAIVHYAGELNRYTNPDLYRGTYLEPYKKYYQEEACKRAGIKFCG